MALPYYVSPEQFMKDKADYARKNIARGYPVLALDYTDGLVFVAENPSMTLRKISEIYDRIAFAGVGRFNEFETLRMNGIRQADIQGYSYSREDVTARSLANAYSQILGQIFTIELKPFEVEILVAQVSEDGGPNEIFHILYDGTPVEEQRFVAMGGKDEELKAQLERTFRQDAALGEVVKIGVTALKEVEAKDIPPENLEIAALDRTRERRKFRRVSDVDVASMLS